MEFFAFLISSLPRASMLLHAPNPSIGAFEDFFQASAFVLRVGQYQEFCFLDAVAEEVICVVCRGRRRGSWNCDSLAVAIKEGVAEEEEIVVEIAVEEVIVVAAIIAVAAVIAVVVASAAAVVVVSRRVFCRVFSSTVAVPPA